MEIEIKMKILEECLILELNILLLTRLPNTRQLFYEKNCVPFLSTIRGHFRWEVHERVKQQSIFSPFG